ncbi:DUF5590 domain-containing protein [uncultured bacterium]|uniref:Cell wall elongation regulator TseB-like domain-containing protein n=2 Tax=Acetilactobacillus jinshanensis TaxID=1720083 RepID=A0A4P6ZL43_9LACO|nr:hypothetical protein ELX58_05280 [Acetilactobacillus jinshanensis]URL61425.1 DUF5590 domain-containing protein [uncultured bacterium]
MRIMQAETLRKQRDRKLLKSISIVVLVIIIGLIIMLFIAQRPMRQARVQSFNTAQKTEGIKRANSFYMSDLNHTYYTIGGPNKRDKKMYVIMNKHHKLVRTVSINSGVSRSAIMNRVRVQDHARKIISVAPAIFNGKTVWIASYENHNKQLCYHTFKYSTGKSLQLITNV